ncbi:MAG: AMP-binding protein, partial [Candidatus Binatia bacterium]
MIRINPGDRFIEFSQDETDQSINERFEKQVLRNPTHIAIQTDRLRLTYDDINKAANRVARALLQQYSADAPVAILMEHDAPAVIAMLGALKASRIFIPLNPLFPDARIAHILNNSGADLIVTNDSGLHTELELFQDRRIVNLDHLDPDLSSDNFDLKIPPATTSYILYTSG